MNPKPKRRKKDNLKGKRNDDHQDKKFKKETCSLEKSVPSREKKGARLKKTSAVEIERTSDNSEEKSSLIDSNAFSNSSHDKESQDSDENVDMESLDDSEERTLEDSSIEMEEGDDGNDSDDGNEEEEEGTIL